MKNLLNSCLTVAAACLLVYYVVLANQLAADTWRLTDARTDLASIREARDALVARQARLDDRDVLMELAIAHGMVPADARTVYLVEPDAMAAR